MRANPLPKHVARAVRDFEHAETILNARRERLEAVFRPLVDAAFATGGETGALEVARLIPCCVTRAFALDRIRYVLPNKPR